MLAISSGEEKTEFEVCKIGKENSRYIPLAALTFFHNYLLDVDEVSEDTYRIQDCLRLRRLTLRAFAFAFLNAKRFSVVGYLRKIPHNFRWFLYAV
ncbi:hypothetical protein TNCV_4841921 [Trichonephila clavipes]|uniref:Uncharacterized protein n=1 Tax=Trichonephila clavipes TaxID=2585209 RepID=A0A8X6WJC1_TRICX|nr:hypothetical protein TNCV_4841921 [Trichonephila clavipes]